MVVETSGGGAVARFSRTIPRRDKTASRETAPETAPSFEDFFYAHVDEVYRFVHRRCRDHDLAEDITQETFLRAIRNNRDLSGISIGWLITVARNCLYDDIRRKNRGDAKLKLLAAPAHRSGHDIDLVERLRVEQALEGLSVDHRLVLTLHYIDGLTVPALAEELGRSVKSVEGLVTRARRAMRALLDDDENGVTDGR